MDINFLLKGLLIGLAIAAPVGPIGLLCMQRTLVSGRQVGLLTGLGAATADALYGATAAFGLTFVSAWLLTYQVELKLVGGLFLCYLGFKTMVSAPTGQSSPATSRAGAYGSTCLLTLTNPATILSFLAIFSGAGLVEAGGSYLAASWLVLGVFSGSAGWWLLLSSGVSLFRPQFNGRRLGWLNRLAGLLIVTFGFAILVSLL